MKDRAGNEYKVLSYADGPAFLGAWAGVHGGSDVGVWATGRFRRFRITNGLRFEVVQEKKTFASLNGSKIVSFLIESMRDDLHN